MNAYLGIDHSYTGFAMIAYFPESDTYERSLTAFPADRYPSEAHRLRAIQKKVSDVIHALAGSGRYLATVAMEGYAPGAKFGREKAGELGGAVKLALLDAGAYIPTVVPPTSLKQFVLGHGKGKKNEIMLGVYKKWGAEFNDDNLADAYVLARMAHAADTQTYQFQYQRQVIENMAK